jgi:hypothetical protein
MFKHDFAVLKLFFNLLFFLGLFFLLGLFVAKESKSFFTFFLVVVLAVGMGALVDGGVVFVLYVLLVEFRLS